MDTEQIKPKRLYSANQTPCSCEAQATFNQNQKDL